MKLEKFKLREPEFKGIQFDGFGDPNLFINKLYEMNLKLGEFYFSFKKEWNPSLEIWLKNKTEVRYTLEHQDYLVASENNEIEILKSSEFYKKYSPIEKSS